MVAGGIGCVVVVGVVLLWKAMRLMVTVLIVGVVIAIGWYVWERVSARNSDHPAPAATTPASGG